MTPTLHPAQAHKFCRYRLGVILVGLLLIFEFHSLFGQVAARATVIPTAVTANPVSTSLESSSQRLANPQSPAALPVPAPSNAPATQVAMVKAISSVQGIRDNQLIGYGIVVGLQNSGDSQMTYFPLQTLLSTLQRLGITVPYPLTSIMVKNMAGVFVEASLPPFAQPGSKIDITVSSTGDARSLSGGMLLMAPLYGADGQIYAEAQGPLVVGGYSVSQNGNSKQMNFPTTARVPNGATVERAIPMDLLHRKTLTLLLNEADFETATRVAATINHSLGGSLAHAIDSRRIDLVVAPGSRCTGIAGSCPIVAGTGVCSRPRGGERAHRHSCHWRQRAAATCFHSPWRPADRRRIAF